MKEVKSRKRKHYINFTDEDRAKIGLYAAENENNSALKKFRAQFPDLGESTVRLKYLALLEEKKREGDRCPTVTAIPSKKKGRPLSLGELDKDVQSYIRALQVTGAPIGSAIIIAAAKGIVMSNDPTQLVENGVVTLNISFLRGLTFVIRLIIGPMKNVH